MSDGRYLRACLVRVEGDRRSRFDDEGLLNSAYFRYGNDEGINRYVLGEYACRGLLEGEIRLREGELLVLYEDRAAS